MQAQPKVFRNQVVGRFEVSTIVHNGGRGHAECMLFSAANWRDEQIPVGTGADPEEVHARGVEKARELSVKIS